MRSIRKTILLCLLSLAAGAVAVPYHTSDYNAPDRGISLSELLRLIQFFNSGGYHCDNFGEDGYAVAPGDTGCTPHDSDYNPQNWLISLSELLRLIQFFNSGGYHFECGTEDGFAPGLGVDCFAGEGEGEGEGETPVVFGDPALEAAIREAIGNPVDPLLPADLLGLTELDASLSSIASLDGIEFCMDLATLDLHGNCIADLTPLDDLTNLISLNLHDNDISDLTPLQGLYNLDLLWLGRNNIESIAPLALNNGLTSDAPNQRWDRINLSFNPLSDGSVPADLATLQDRNVFIWTNTLPSAKHLWSAEARLRFAEAGLPAATKAITADHPFTAIAAEGSSSSLPRREQASSTKAGARPRTPKIGAPLSARVELEFTGSRVRLLNHELIPGPAPLPKRSTGRNGSLRITDNMRNTVMAALDFSLEATACGEIDESGESAGELIHLDADQRSFLLPLQGMLTRIEYLPTEGEPQILYEASLIAKGIEDCMPVEEPGDPIPISAQLIHGDPNLPDEQAYVLLLMGDGFVLDNLGDPFLTESVHATSFLDFSRSMADSMAYIFSQEPFQEYADFFKVYRVDLISADDLPTDLSSDPPILRDTALGMEKKSVGFDYDKLLCYRVANNTGINWDRIVLFPNGTGSGTQSADFIVYSALQTSRRVTALHEFGHGVGVLVDEYEYRHGTNPPESLDPDTVIEPNAISLEGAIPTLDEIPWRHWLPQTDDCPTGYLGGVVDYGCVNDELGQCQCGPVPLDPMDCVPLPTCEPDGDYFDGDGKIYGRVEWPEPGDPDDVIGLFEGAKYRNKGAWRAQLRCRMRSIDDVPSGETLTPRFCVACRENLVLEFLGRAGLSAAVSPDTSEAVLFDGSPLEFSVLPHAPASHAIEIVEWSIDGAVQPGEFGTTLVVNTAGLDTNVQHVVSVTLHDSTAWIHPDHPLADTVTRQQITWTLSAAAP